LIGMMLGTKEGKAGAAASVHEKVKR
jgi:hypothetical protein